MQEFVKIAHSTWQFVGSDEEAATQLQSKEFQNILAVNNEEELEFSLEPASTPIALKKSSDLSCELIIEPTLENYNFDFQHLFIQSSANNIEIYRESQQDPNNREYLGTTSKEGVIRSPIYCATCTFKQHVRACRKLTLKFVSLQQDKQTCKIFKIMFSGLKVRQNHQVAAASSSGIASQNEVLMNQVMSSLLMQKGASVSMGVKAPMNLPKELVPNKENAIVEQEKKSSLPIETLVQGKIEKVVQEQVEPMLKAYVDEKMKQVEEAVYNRLLAKLQEK